MGISVSEAAKLAGVERQAIYKALGTGRLTEMTSLGKKGVKEDQKLKDFMSVPRNGKSRPKGKP